jgi:hypothetical protein
MTRTGRRTIAATLPPPESNPRAPAVHEKRHDCPDQEYYKQYLCNSGG